MVPELDTPDIVLMMRVRAGDAAAFETLHERYQRCLLNFFFGMSRHAPTASDLCQETFLRVWQVRKRYQASGTFPAYLFGIARMVWREHCRKQSRDWQFRCDSEQHFEAAVDTHHTPDYQASCSEMQHYILEALQELPEEQRMVFVMRTIRGLSLEDIATAMDCPLNTVRSRKLLGIKRLRHLLMAFFHKQEDRILEEDRQR
jgi:RNA polymerase sigma-70 factor, ECF subfamily